MAGAPGSRPVTGRVAGKKVLITGAAQGLGAAAARLLAREGAQILVSDRNPAGAEIVARAINDEVGANTASFLEQDVTSETGWPAAIEAARIRMGGLSVLVNNAGIVTTGSVEDLSFEEWRHGMNVNADSVFLGCKYALPLLRHNQPGSIINMSSIAGLIASHNFASYNASKAAVWLLSKSVALHCARHGWDIRCNSIHPAFVRTPILLDLTKRRDPEAVMRKLVKQVPLGRLGEPNDVAHAVVYLASDESRFMTGAEIKLDGGISAM